MLWNFLRSWVKNVCAKLECLVRLGWKGLLERKHSSLSQTFINYGRKKFYNIGHWAQCYETFYGRELETVVPS